MHYQLRSGEEIGIIEGKGKQILDALANSNKNKTDFFKEFLLQMVYLDEKPITPDFLEEMSLKDTSYLLSVINTLLDDNFQI